MVVFFFFFFEGDGDHRVLHGLAPSFPTRRSSDVRGAPLSERGARAAARTDRRFRLSGIDAHARACLLQPPGARRRLRHRAVRGSRRAHHRSEEHTSELQSLMRISYAVFCLKKKISMRNKKPSILTAIQYT